MTEVSAGDWFDDRDIVRQFPIRYRAYAAYCRWMVNRATGRIPGGSFLFRVLSRMTRWLHLKSDAAVRVSDTTVHLDLRDPRMLWVLAEARGEGDETRILKQVLSPG